MGRLTTIITGVVSLVVLLTLLFIGYKWAVERVYVAQDEVLVVIEKFGDPLPSGLVVIPKDKYGTYKGVREEVLGPGRYFFNPVYYETRIEKVRTIRAGSPDKFVFDNNGQLTDPSVAPEVGLLIRKQGDVPLGQPEVVDNGFKGIQKDVLTPGDYKLNPFLYELKEVPAVVVPPGSVGVRTRLFGDDVSAATMVSIATTSPATVPSTRPVAADPMGPSRLASGANQRGVLKDVLQPGIYYLNPRMYKVDILPIGYDDITLDDSPTPGKSVNSNGVKFLSADGYQVEADITLIWGISPSDAPTIVANIGSWETIENNVIKQAMISACQNEGAKFTAKELIQGSTRSKFQDDLDEALRAQVGSRNIDVLLALIRNISVKDTATGADATMGLLATIQSANIEVERQITNRKKTETERKRAELEQANKLVDVARETVASETKVKVANILADGQKKAAETDAKRELDVATVALEISALEAQTTTILGKAQADVARLKNDADAQGAKMMVDAFGTPAAYNNYIFAKNFQPTDLKMIFAGPGTLWTDLKSFQEIGAVKQIEQQVTPKK